MMRYIGVDPGASGGIAILTGDCDVVCAAKMPETERDVLDLLRIYATDSRAVLELVHAMPRSKMGAIGAFKLGRAQGALRMALAAAGIPFDEVTPGKWQRALGCLTGGDKKVSYRKAQQLFPTVKITHAIADSLLIAEYCRRLEVRP